MNVTQANIIDQSIEFAKAKMKNLHASHGWDHVHRVIALAEKIAFTENKADHFIVTISAILHDIARGVEDKNPGTVDHADLGSRMAYDFLTDIGVEKSSASHIADCILTHRYRNSHIPSTIEAKILYDADKLDSIGAVGIGRAFLFSGEVGAKLHDPNVDLDMTRADSEDDKAYREYIAKLRFVKDRMLTKEGKRIALERDKFMEIFFKRIDAEVRGVQ